MEWLASRCPRTIMPTVGKHRPERYDGEVPAAPGQEWQAEALSARRTGAGSPMWDQSLLDVGQSYHHKRIFFNGDGNFGQGFQFGANRGGRPRARWPACGQLSGNASEGGAEDAYLQVAQDWPGARERQTRQARHSARGRRPVADSAG